jgi:hypothetical protein
MSIDAPLLDIRQFVNGSACVVKSSWRWDSDEEFRANTNPQFINPVRHVWNYERLYSFAQCGQEMYKDLAELRDANERLAQALEATSRRGDHSGVHNVALDVCHHGEKLLLFQKRLALSDSAYGFLQSKDAIEHELHAENKSRMSTAIVARTASSIATIARDRSVGMRSRRIARNAITGILPTRIDDAIQPMDARLAANEMTEAVFDALDLTLNGARTLRETSQF